MNSLILVFCVSITFCWNVYANDISRPQGGEYITLYSHVINTGGETNVWRISEDVLKRIPLWHMDDGEPPLAISKAVKLAKAWIVSKGCNADSWVATLTIRPIYATSGKRLASYYNILFGGVGIYGHFRRCVVLMDGTVVEPIWLYTKAPGSSEYYYYDE